MEYYDRPLSTGRAARYPPPPIYDYPGGRGHVLYRGDSLRFRRAVRSWDPREEARDSTQAEYSYDDRDQQRYGPRRNSLLDRIEGAQSGQGPSLQERLTVPSVIPLAQRITMKVEEPEEIPMPKEKMSHVEADVGEDSRSAMEVIDLTQDDSEEEKGEEPEEGEVVEDRSQHEPEIIEIEDDEGMLEDDDSRCGPSPTTTPPGTPPLSSYLIHHFEDLAGDVQPLKSSEHHVGHVELDSRTETQGTAVHNQIFPENRNTSATGAMSPVAVQVPGPKTPPLPPPPELHLEHDFDATVHVSYNGSIRTSEHTQVEDNRSNYLPPVMDHIPLAKTPDVPPQESTFAAPTVIETIRNKLLPLMVLNSQLQNPNATFDHKHVESLLNDDQCRNFLRQSQTVAQELNDLAAQGYLTANTNPAPVSAQTGTKRPLSEVDDNDQLESRPKKRAIRFDRDDSQATLVHNSAPSVNSAAPASQHHEETSSTDMDHDLGYSAGRWVQTHVGRRDFYDPNLPSPNLDRLPTSVSIPLRRNAHVYSPSEGRSSAESSSGSPYIRARHPVPAAEFYDHPSTPLSVVPSNRIHYKEDAPSNVAASEPPTSICRVPGLWFVKLGAPHSDVLECHFDVPPDVAAAAQRWVRPGESFEAEASHVSVRVLCLQRKAVEAALQQAGEQASPEDITTLIGNIPTQWPIRGSLIIDMNVGQPREHMWFADSLTPDSPPLAVTSAIQPGHNHIRIIQLADLSDCLFVVHAGPPSEGEIEAARRVRESKSRLQKMIEERSASASWLGTSFDIKVTHTVIAK